MESNSNRELAWTGERFVPGCGSQLLYEHVHRYAVAAELAAGRRVLDIACGEGYGSDLLATTAADVIGMDIAPEVIEYARKTYSRDNLTFCVGSCLDIPLESHTVDLLVSFETIEHIDDHTRFLQEIKRVLTQNGVLVISSPDKEEYTDRRGVENPFHKRELYHHDFELLLREHFAHCRISRQRLIAGSWIAPDIAAAGDIFGTFSGDLHSVNFQPGVQSAMYSIALCSDAPLAPWKLGVYANREDSDTVWHLLDSFGNAAGIQNAIVSLKHAQNEARQLRDRLTQTTDRLTQTTDQLTQTTDRLTQTTDQLTQTTRKLHATRVELNRSQADLRQQLQRARKLTWFLKETEKAARRLRSSRRWKMSNPFAALREVLGGREMAGYGHLEKVISDYSKWRTQNPQLEQIEKQIKAFDPDVRGTAERGLGNNGKAAAPIAPLAPRRPIRFPIHQHAEVSIIIPVFNQLAYTQACLASIQENQANQPIEVVVVDDCSTDDTTETLSKIPGLRYLRNEKNLGFVVSGNRGATQAQGEYLLFLNNDTLVTPGWLSSLLETFDLEPEAGLVGSKLIYPDGRLQEAGGIIWRDGSGWNRGKFGDRDDPTYNFLREVDYCSAACVMVSKSLFEQVGGFDSRFAPGYYEDTDLAFKIRDAGRKVLYQPLSEVIHFEGATGGTDLSAGAKKYQEINRSAFQSKWAEVLATKPANGDIAAWERLSPGCKRILVIDHHLPMPDRDSGSARMFGILTILHELGHRVTFIPDNLANNVRYADELRKRGIEIIVRPHIKSIEEYLQGQGPILDVVILSRCGTAMRNIAEVRLYAPQSRVIFDTVDLHFVRIGREAELTRTAESINRAGAIRAQELDLIRNVDETWVVSEVERQLLLSDLPDQTVEVVSNIVEVVEPETPFSKRTDLLFIGSFLHPPNVDAVLFFVNEIHPLIVQRLPEIKCYIIGDKAPAEITTLASDTIIVTGPVADVRPYFESVKLSVAPIRYGAGVKGKINQSMGLGVPVVATSIAIEGMSLTKGEDVLVADDPARFAEYVTELYQSEEIWNHLSKNGLAKTRSLYSAEIARARLSRSLNQNQATSRYLSRGEASSHSVLPSAAKNLS